MSLSFLSFPPLKEIIMKITLLNEKNEILYEKDIDFNKGKDQRMKERREVYKRQNKINTK